MSKLKFNIKNKLRNISIIFIILDKNKKKKLNKK